MSLSGFWHAAAALSGRIDLSEAHRQSDKLSHLSDGALALYGVQTRHITRLRRTPTLNSDHNALILDSSASFLTHPPCSSTPVI